MTNKTPFALAIICCLMISCNSKKNQQGEQTQTISVRRNYLQSTTLIKFPFPPDLQFLFLLNFQMPEVCAGEQKELCL